MDINTIIEQVLSNSITSSKSNIELNENSDLWNLLHKNPNNDSNCGEKFAIGKHIKERYNNSLNRRFPITYFIYSLLVYLAKLMVYSFYRAASFFKSMFTGKPCDLSQSPRFNFIVFIAACIFYIMLIVAILIFFVKSVLLFSPDTRVNDNGAIAMPQSCERENYMYLLNTATFWSNSGIKVLKGDDVSISVSGSFFSDIDEMYKSALNNSKPKYDRTFVTFDNSRKHEPDSSIHSYFLLTNIKDIKKVKEFKDPFPVKKGDPTFGSLLVAIRDASQSKPFNEESIITQNDTNAKVLAFTADRSGYLNFAVNDEYIDAASFRIIQNSITLQKQLGIYNTAKIRKDGFETIKKNEKDSLSKLKPALNIYSNAYYFTKTDIDLIKTDTTLQRKLGFDKYDIDTLISWADWNENIARMWYNDNVGDILINVKITRNTIRGSAFEPGIMTKTYRKFEDFFLTPYFWKNNIMILILIAIAILAWFISDHFLGNPLLAYAAKKSRPLRQRYRIIQGALSRKYQKGVKCIKKFCKRKLDRLSIRS